MAAEFAEKYNSYMPSPSPVEMDSSLQITNQLPELHAHVMENRDLGSMVFSNDFFLPQQPGFQGQYMNGLSGFSTVECPDSMSVPLPVVFIGEQSKKRKAISVPDTTSGNSSTPFSEIGLAECSKSKKKNNSGRGKRGRDTGKEVEKLREVVHVRARRGQATDSHSLAERVRREKINERMRYLQDLVPGCYKTMGMAGMLDEIINYVQSLQNQVEFLSMKLSAASSFHEFGLEMDAIETSQVGDLPYEVEQVDRLIREGYGGCSSFHTTLPF